MDTAPQGSHRPEAWRRSGPRFIADAVTPRVCQRARLRSWTRRLAKRRRQSVETMGNGAEFACSAQHS